MATVPNVPEPERTAKPMGRTRIVLIRLKEVLNPSKSRDEFGNRSPDKYLAENNLDLIESVKVHGLLEPPLIARGKDGKWRLICGHRRIAVLYILADRGVAGFSLEMEVQCLEVLDASDLDLLTRSILDNELGKKLEPKERLVAVKKLDAAGASKKEIAATVGASEKSIARDLLVVGNARILQHVLADNLLPTVAAAIIAVATPKGRVDEFLDHFDSHVLKTTGAIEEDDRRAKLERGKGLKPSQMLVANRLEPHVVRGWIDALAKGKPLTEERDLGIEATFDKKSAVATIKVKVDARNDAVGHIARVASQISQVAKHLAAFAQKRNELEGPMGPQAALQKDVDFLDKELLAQFGLENVIDLEMEPAMEESPLDGSTPQENQNDAKDGK